MFDRRDDQSHSSMTPALSGGLSHHARVPSKFQVGVEFEELFLKGCEAVTRRFNVLGGIGEGKLPDSILMVALEANSGVVCPGFLGSRRPAVEARLDRLFGRAGWKTQHVVAGRLAGEAAALAFYERGYIEHFRKNPDVLNWLCQNHSDVYDTAPSNVTSGLDYSAQELPGKGRHLHDIAIRRAVKALDRRFEGTELLEVRGPNSKGFCLSPGEIPFAFPDLIPKTEIPTVRPWWKPGTIEDFYQRSRRIVVLQFADTNCVLSEQGNQPEQNASFCARVASRFFLRMLPITTASQVGLGHLNELPWMLDKNTFPSDASGLPRALTTEECRSIIRALHEQFTHFFRKSTNSEALLGANPWLGFEKSAEFVLALNCLVEKRPLDYEQHKGFPDFSDMQVWSNALKHFWSHTYGEGKRPLHLARDGWIPMEYLSYRSDLIGQDREHCKRSVYIPGTSIRSSLTKNNRGQSADLEHLVETLTNFAVESIENPVVAEGTKSVRDDFCDRVRSWIAARGEDGSDRASVWRPIYEQIKEQFPDGTSNLVVVDSDGTGKSAQFIATMLEYFARQDDPRASIGVLLGGMKGTAFSPPLGVPNIADMYMLPSDSTSGRHLPDARWPFSFAEYSPDPKFNVEKHPARYLVLCWRSMQLYNQAVRDTYSTNASEESTSAS